jgi:hypothetical protein
LGFSRARDAWGRTVLWLAIVAAVCGAATLLYYRRAHALPDVAYETTPADRGTVVAKVTATGNLSALLTVQVGSQVSGRVQELFVDYNSPVKKGQTIAKLDPLLFEAAAEQAKALVLSAKSTIEKDQAQDVNMKIAYERSPETARCEGDRAVGLRYGKSQLRRGGRAGGGGPEQPGIGQRGPSSGGAQSQLHDNRFADRRDRHFAQRRRRANRGRFFPGAHAFRHR